MSTACTRRIFTPAGHYTRRRSLLSGLSFLALADVVCGAQDSIVNSHNTWAHTTDLTCASPGRSFHEGFASEIDAVVVQIAAFQLIDTAAQGGIHQPQSSQPAHGSF